jgi:hypothetical protein
MEQARGLCTTRGVSVRHTASGLSRGAVEGQWPDTQLTSCNRDPFRKRTRQCCGKTAAVVTHHRRPPVPIHPRSLTASQHESTGPRGCVVRTRQPSNGPEPWLVSQTMCGNSGEPFPGDMARSSKCKRMYCAGGLVHFAELASCANFESDAFRLAAIKRLGEKDWIPACMGISGKDPSLREDFCVSDDLSESFAAPAFLPYEARRCEQHVHRFAVHSAENL